jgi:hypothetical protein
VWGRALQSWVGRDRWWWPALLGLDIWRGRRYQACVRDLVEGSQI